ncbi:hypothetical protein [Paracoccus sp. IB05]|uniref:hypothetical protein n=1 Tax=Paracoccus sp. IB05 TaxID=2779367 RepID=UPI0018E82991|nr:hypothetical protein [Paracoccus sp. IB05]MBJ2153662.1 hypothetical protein [Paracoccus sp. IB05]
MSFPRLSFFIASIFLLSALPLSAEPAFDVSTGRDQPECAAAIELASGLTPAEIENGSWTTQGRTLEDAEILLGRSRDGDWLLTSPDHFERLEIDPSWQKTVYWQREASGDVRLVGIINHDASPEHRFMLYAVDTVFSREKFLQGLVPPPSNLIIYDENLNPLERWPYARDILRMTRPTPPIILLNKRSGQVQLIDVMEFKSSNRRWMILTPEAEQDVSHCSLWYR